MLPQVRKKIRNLHLFDLVVDFFVIAAIDPSFRFITGFMQPELDLFKHF